MLSRKHPHAAQVRPLQEIIEEVESPSFVMQRIGSEAKIGRTHHYEEKWEGEMKIRRQGELEDKHMLNVHRTARNWPPHNGEVIGQNGKNSAFAIKSQRFKQQKHHLFGDWCIQDDQKKKI
jgi:hypothetical protein